MIPKAQAPSGSVVVITGASSGIGRAAAVAFAQGGARVVVAARRSEPLRTLVGEIEQAGGQALAVPVDVTDEGEVRALAERAVQHFGHLDVWVNNAAVTVYGRFQDTPPDAFRRVVETDFFGYVHGARAALPHFQRQGRGVLINNASVHGVGGSPYITPYVASKFAVRGFSEALRQELRGTGISICTILPAAIDTPLFQHAANYTGRALKPLNPTYDAVDVAKAMVRCAERPRREVFVGNAGRMLALLHTVAPAVYERVMARQVERDEFQQAPAPQTTGNLFAPVSEGADVSGGWKAPTAGQDGPVRRGLALGKAALVPALRLAQRRQRRDER